MRQRLTGPSSLLGYILVWFGVIALCTLVYGAIMFAVARLFR